MWHVTILNTFKSLYKPKQRGRRCRAIFFSCLLSPHEGCLSRSHSHPQKVQVCICDPDCWACGLSWGHSVCSASCSAYLATSPDLPKRGRHRKMPHTWSNSLCTVDGASQDWHSYSLLWGPVSSVPTISWNNLTLILLKWFRKNRSIIVVQLRKAGMKARAGTGKGTVLEVGGQGFEWLEQDIICTGDWEGIGRASRRLRLSLTEYFCCADLGWEVWSSSDVSLS